MSSNFSYGLAAVYNAQVWDFDEEFHDPPGDFFDLPVPSKLWNAGLGWMVGFGRLFPPESGHSPENDSNQWLYVDASGNKHHFYSRLHLGDPIDPAGRTFYSRDNSYLRLKLDDATNPTSITVEFPDGRRHVFEHQNLGDVASGWYPVALVDAYGGADEVFDRLQPVGMDHH